MLNCPICKVPLLRIPDLFGEARYRQTGARIEITPVGKPRQTQRDKWMQRPNVMAYRAFADKLRAETKRHRITVPDAGLSLLFELPMPASWSKKKRREMLGQPHRQKPDIDNLTKAVLDSLCGEDCTIWQLAGLEKRWAEVGAITFKLRKTSKKPAAIIA